MAFLFSLYILFHCFVALLIYSVSQKDSMCRSMRSMLLLSHNYYYLALQILDYGTSLELVKSRIFCSQNQFSSASELQRGKHFVSWCRLVPDSNFVNSKNSTILCK
uniref:Putative secreted protein n=1 Tax=Ixodes scapularis TaxID=6945 RepID=A0A4D5RGA0_IXOSC